MLGFFSLFERLGSHPLGGGFAFWAGGGGFALFFRSTEGDGWGFDHRRHLASGVFELFLVLSGLVAILGSGGRDLALRSDSLVAGVGDPLGNSTLGSFSEARSCNSHTGVVNIGSPIGRCGDFACGEASARFGGWRLSRLLGSVGGDAELSAWSPLGGFQCGGLLVVGDGPGGSGVLLHHWWLWVVRVGGFDSGGGSAVVGGCGIRLLGLLVGGCCSKLLGLLYFVCLGLGFCDWLWAFIFYFYVLFFDGSANFSV